VTAQLTLEQVACRYRHQRTGRPIDALRADRLDINAGEAVAVLGPNGSGKSTLLETLALLLRPAEGRVVLDGRDPWAERTVLQARRRCAMLLQRSVLFQMSVWRNVAYGPRARGLGRAEVRRRVAEVLELTQLSHLARRGHRELSGGERQRVALARLLAVRPDVLLLDEPTAHVDRENARLIERLIATLHRDSAVTVVLATHDAGQARRLADRVITLVDGRPIEGTADNLLRGTLAGENGVLHFHGDGLRLSLPREALATPAHDAPADRDTPVQLTIDPLRIGLVPLESLSGEQALNGNRGQIEAVHRHGEHCRIEVQLPDACTLHAELPLSAYQHARLNIGQSVAIRFDEQSVRVLNRKS